MTYRAQIDLDELPAGLVLTSEEEDTYSLRTVETVAHGRGRAPRATAWLTRVGNAPRVFVVVDVATHGGTAVSAALGLGPNGLARDRLSQGDVQRGRARWPAGVEVDEEVRERTRPDTGPPDTQPGQGQGGGGSQSNPGGNPRDGGR